MLKTLKCLSKQKQAFLRASQCTIVPERLHNVASSEVDNSLGKDGHYDVIIVGGGGAGISLAGAICKCGP